MRSLIRSFDWTQTPIGPPENWSKRLCMMVSVLLANRFPLLLWWGPRYIQIYNDPYRPVLGAKHPHSLGLPASECWSEVWAVIGPLIDAAFESGETTWREDIELSIHRHGYLEECHFTIAFSPVPDPTAPRGIGGVLATVHEITTKVIGQRRVAILSELGPRVTETQTPEQVCAMAAQILVKHIKDLPFVLMYLLEPDASHLRRLCDIGVAAGWAGPARISLDSVQASTPWPLAEVIQTENAQIMEGVSPVLETPPQGSRPEVSHVVVLPVKSNLVHRPAGALVIGVSSHIALDSEQLAFFDRLSSHLATAVANTKAHEAQRRRADTLAEIDRAKSTFFSNFSHEFRTPLTLVLGPLQEMLEDPATPPAARERLQLAHRNSLRLLKRVNSLLDFSRVEAGCIQAAYEPTDLTALTRDLANTFRSAVEHAGLSLEIHCEELGEAVDVDREMWETIVLNLLSNALEFTLRGTITVRLQRYGFQAVLEVIDTGVGVPRPEIPRIFERFHRVQSTEGRTQEGAGIGLALVLELVRLHEGTIEVASELGVGSTFRVRLPFGLTHRLAHQGKPTGSMSSIAIDTQPILEEPQRWITASSRPALAETSTPLSDRGHEASIGARIVLADDDADLRSSVHDLLCPLYSVEAVADGDEALAAARRQLPDLVLAKVMMPRRDGFSLLKALRSEAGLHEIPVILLSARSDKETRIEGLDSSADDYLVKPFSAGELLARVGASLKLARARRAFEYRIANDLKNMRRLHELGSRYSRGGQRFQDCLEDSLEVAISMTNADKGNIQLLRSGSNALQIIAHRGFEPPFLAFFANDRASAAAACGAALASARRVVVEDVMNSEIFAATPALGVLLEARVRAVQSTPLLSSTGETLGIISTHFARPHRPSEGVLGLMDLLARQAADYLERRQTEDTLRRSEVLLSGQKTALERAISGASLEAVLSEIVQSTQQQICGNGRVALFVTEHEGTQLRLAASAGLSQAEQRSVDRLSAPPPSASGTPVFIGQTSIQGTFNPDSHWPEALKVIEALGICAGWFHPIRTTGGHSLGSLVVFHDLPRTPESPDLTVMQFYSDTAAIIIERDQRLQERQRAEALLRLRLAQFETLLNEAPSGVYLVDADFRIRDVNSTARDILADFQPLVGRDFADMIHFLQPQHSADELVALCRRTLATGEPYRTSEPIDTPLDREVDESHEWHIRRIPLPEGGLGLACYVRDVSSHVKARQALQTADRQKNEFLAMLAHELRNPLAPLRNAAELLSRALSADEHLQAMTGIVHRQVSHLTRLVDDLLDVSRISQGRIELKRRAIPLAGIIEQAVETVESLVQEKHQTLSVVGERALRVNADPARLLQCVANILTNAAKYTDPHGEIRIESSQRDGEAVLTIIDNGSGISPDLLPRVFDLFVQSDRTLDRAQGGLGIGLSVVKRLIEMHEGRVTASSAGPGQGATFQIFLPLVQDEGDVAPEIPNHPTRSLRILIVDDDVDAADSIAMLLRLEGHHTATAYAPHEALAQVPSLQPELILLDIGLPDIDGYELARRLRAADHLGGVRLVALTGYGQAEDRQRARDAGFDDHLVKPVEFATLKQILAAVPGGG